MERSVEVAKPHRPGDRGVLCADVVTSVGVTGGVRREHDTDGGYEHEP